MAQVGFTNTIPAGSTSGPKKWGTIPVGYKIAGRIEFKTTKLYFRENPNWPNYLPAYYQRKIERMQKEGVSIPRTAIYNYWFGDSSGAKIIQGGSFDGIEGQESYEYENYLTEHDTTALSGKDVYLFCDDNFEYVQLLQPWEVTFWCDQYMFFTRINQATGGTVTASPSPALPGTTVTLTATPSTGYRFVGWQTSGPAIANNQFVIQSQDVTVTPVFEKIQYTISLATNKANAGYPVASTLRATYQDDVTLSQSPADGYYFDGWSIDPQVPITNDSFRMPAAGVTVTANYLKRSTCSLSSTTLTGGVGATLTLTTEDSKYTHSYTLDFGGGMSTSGNIAAGTTKVTITAPISWCSYVTNAVKKTGGTLTLTTRRNGVTIGTYSISGLTFAVPSSVVPNLPTPTAEIVRTISGRSYANVGNYYVQNHCGVRIRASATGQYSASINDMKVEIVGYSGGSYNATQAGASLDFTSGLLSIAGTTTIRVTATDSRSRTTVKTITITVTAYNPPNGSLSVWRVDGNRDADDNGDYALFSLTRNYSNIGSNSLATTISCSLGSKSEPGTSGDLLPGNRKTFLLTNEYEITLTLQDQFETTTIKQILPSAKYAIYLSSDGNRIGFMRAATKTPPAGKTGTFEIADHLQIYIGNTTLEDYIRAVMGS